MRLVKIDRVETFCDFRIRSSSNLAPNDLPTAWRYYLVLSFAGLNPLHLQPGKLQFWASFVFSYIGPYIRT